MNNSTELLTPSSPTFSGFVFSTNVVLMSVGAVALIGNGLVSCVILKYRSLREKLNAIYLIGYLAIADAITGLGCIIAAIDRFRVTFSTAPQFNRASCLGTSVVMIFGFLASQMMVGWVALDRITAVSDPLGYSGKDHPKIALRTWFFTMIFCLICALSIFEGDLSVVPPVCNGGASVTARFLMFWLVYTSALEVVIIVGYIVMLVRMWQKSGTAVGNSALATQVKQQAKITKVVSLILAVYVSCWVFPIMLFNIGAILRMPRSIMGIIGPTSSAGAVISSAANIFIYSYKLPEFWEYFKHFLKCQGDNTFAPKPTVGNSHPKHNLSPTVPQLHSIRSSQGGDLSHNGPNAPGSSNQGIQVVSSFSNRMPNAANELSVGTRNVGSPHQIPERFDIGPSISYL